jgi:hypothetical protein
MNAKKGTDKRFEKLVKHIVQKSSPSDNPMGVVDEEEAIDQEAPKKLKLKSVDLPGKAFH